MRKIKKVYLFSLKKIFEKEIIRIIPCLTVTEVFKYRTLSFTPYGSIRQPKDD